MARRNPRASRGQHSGRTTRWAGRRSRAVVTIRARRRDLARLRAEHARDTAPLSAMCWQCAGSGQVAGDTCSACHGNGRLSGEEPGH